MTLSEGIEIRKKQHTIDQITFTHCQIEKLANHLSATIETEKSALLVGRLNACMASTDDVIKEIMKT